MTVLLVLIPSRPRLQARGAGAIAPTSATEYRYGLSRDGQTIDSTGQSAAALLPKAQQAIAVLADTDVAWHRIKLPKAPSGRLALALMGVMEEVLLDDADNTHLAVAPGAVAGQPTWVAAVHRPWLQAHLAVLEKAQVGVDRVVPGSWPDEPASGHFWQHHGDGAQPKEAPHTQLTWSQAQGVSVLPVQGSLAKRLLPETLLAEMRWSATAEAAVDAERWLGAPVAVVSPAQHALQATRTLWNLRQFNLARTHRGSRLLQDAWQQLWGPDWRPVRFGLAALLAIQLVGLNLWAAHLNDRVKSQRQQLTTVLQTEFPQVRAVLDAPLQMEREVQSLRLRAGQPSSQDLEPLLAAAASAWPTDMGPAPDLRYEPGQLSLSASGWTPSHIDLFQTQMRASGWQVRTQDDRLLLRPAAAVGAPRSAL